VADCLTNSSIPCKTLNFAYYGRNVSAEDELYDNISQSPETASSHVSFIILPGIYRNDPPLLVLNSTNVSFAAEEPGTVTIRCANFPNLGDTGYGSFGNYSFDDVNIDSSLDVSLRGLIFEKCGNFNSAVHVRNVDGLSVVNCTFRESTGTALQIRQSSNVVVETCWFVNNIDARIRHLPRDPSQEVDVSTLLEQVLLGGALTFFSRSRTTASLTIQDCVFEGNHGSSINDEGSPVLLRESGHGGGVLVQISNVTDSLILIEDSTFSGNTADVDGGGVYVALSDGVNGNRIIFRKMTFLNNSASEASGGAISFNSFQISYNNTIEIVDSRFESNNASAGGAVSFVLYQSDPDLPPDNLVFRNCVFVENTAENDGTAVGLFSLLHVDEFGFPVWFQDCIFENSLSQDQNLDTSALAAFRFPVTLNGSNVFRNNSGGAITLLNTQMDAFGEVVMDGNTAAFGGGLAMDDRCLLNLHPGVVMNLTNNHATMFGGGIYLQLPALRFIIQYFNRLCFVQFNAEGLADVPPEEWDASVNFINNSAGESGAAIFASDFFGCSWLGNTQTDLIFRPNVTASPFYYENNRLLPSGSFTKSEELGSRALNLFADVFKSRSSVQPGEVVFINITVTDQLGNRKEGLLSVSGPRYNDITAFGGNDDPYIFRVPALSVLRDKLSENFTGDFDVNITMSLLRSVGLPVNITLTIVVDCHPGYHLVDDLCVLSSSTPGILEASRNNRHVIITEGMYAWPDSHNRLVVSNVPPGYIQCTRRIGLQGCFAKFDNLDQQCLPSRKGVLCGDCAEEDYGISLSLSECSSSCTAGQVLFVILCEFV
jgi:predicted outer membrane repeat protein